jgi:hypothetical protein
VISFTGISSRPDLKENDGPPRVALIANASAVG